MTQVPKDERLAGLADRFNVAQFVSFSPGANPQVRYRRIHGEPGQGYSGSIAGALSALLEASSGTVNIRSFRLGQDKGNPFHYGIDNAANAAAAVSSLAAEGYFTIANETIDTHDGGVSGVSLGGILEYTPHDTPRGVEKPDAVSMPYDLGIRLLAGIYGFRPEVAAAEGARIEFSIHPARVGYRRGHTILWETEQVEAVRLQARISWPNRLSRLIGDKAYGLLIADLLDLPVPATTVIGRAVAPFTFGRSTGTTEFWMRTCPREPQPGQFPTTFGWQDPYDMMAREDPDGSAIASVLSQESVDALYSGASLPGGGGEQDYIEGISGHGDAFMLGEHRPETLPEHVVRDVRGLTARAREILGPVRIEFAHDGQQAWVVQLHLSPAQFRPGVICPGTPLNGWLDFEPASGLDPLRKLIDRAKGEGRGVRVTGPVGITSHVGDLLRRAGVPAILDPRS
jgi:hypothetical protein